MKTALHLYCMGLLTTATHKALIKTDTVLLRIDTVSGFKISQYFTVSILSNTPVIHSGKYDVWTFIYIKFSLMSCM